MPDIPLVEPTAKKEEPEEVTFPDVLQSTPPNVQLTISDLYRRVVNPGGPSFYLTTPDIELHCTAEKCEGTRTFKCTSSAPYINDGWNFEYLTYQCRNCQKTRRTFAIAVLKVPSSSELKGNALKLGETPPFGPHTPSRVISLIGPDRDLFLKGRRAESAGLGIGAFAYYRRVIENQKGRIIAEIGKVAKRLGADARTIAQFEKAENETQFSRAMEDVKDAMPQSLLINGQNPLGLLHSALSEGLRLHELEDKKCLELAQSVRAVMTELAERISRALEEKKELDDAVSRLLSAKTK